MRTEQRRWIGGHWDGPAGLPDAQVVFVFGDRAALSAPDVLSSLRVRYPSAVLFGCSTAGDVAGTSVVDGGVVSTAMVLTSTRVQFAFTQVPTAADSRRAGEALASQLDQPGLRHVLVLSDGLRVNGSHLVDGIASRLPPDVGVTGGLAADGTAFEETLVVAGESAKPGVVAGLGFFGDALRVGYASLGGWDPFGPVRTVTKARGSVLFELDGLSALELYRRYLGEHARELPSSALLFPLTIWQGDPATAIVRTVLAVDEAAGTMTFAGDVPLGWNARLMKANFDRLIDGASGAAGRSQHSVTAHRAEFALLISCVGRKLVLRQRTDEEVEAVSTVLGPQARLAGFYSYGEISPFTPEARCQLHNQTMTITTFAEAGD